MLTRNFVVADGRLEKIPERQNLISAYFGRGVTLVTSCSRYLGTMIAQLDLRNNALTREQTKNESSFNPVEQQTNPDESRKEPRS